MSKSNVDFAELSRWAEALLPAAERAGAAILKIRAQGFDVAAKSNSSPVTAADHAAEAVILETLERFSPAFPIVAEERAAAGNIPTCENAFWLVDALDGTREFVKGGSDFTVNIGFIWHDLPVLGIVHAPARHETFWGIVGANADEHRAEVIRDGRGAPISVRARPKNPVAAGSKSHEVPERMAEFVARHHVGEHVAIGSSLKFCLVAEGFADLYPRFGPTHEWDTAAGHAVLRAAGGRVTGPDGAEMRYNKPKFLNGEFLAEGRR